MLSSTLHWDLVATTPAIFLTTARNNGFMQMMKRYNTISFSMCMYCTFTFFTKVSPVGISDVLEQGPFLLLYDLCGKNTYFLYIVLYQASCKQTMQMRAFQLYHCNSAHASHLISGSQMRLNIYCTCTMPTTFQHNFNSQIIQVYMEMIRMEAIKVCVLNIKASCMHIFFTHRLG